MDKLILKTGEEINISHQSSVVLQNFIKNKETQYIVKDISYPIHCIDHIDFACLRYTFNPLTITKGNPLNILTGNNLSDEQMDSKLECAKEFYKDNIWSI